MTEQAKAWLDRATEDLQALALLEKNPDLNRVAAFHAQQGLEKALKAAVVLKGSPIPRSHDLVRLAAVADPLPGKLEDNLLIELTSLYTESRYPADVGLLPGGIPSSAAVQRYHGALTQFIAEVGAAIARAGAAKERSHP
jgi:HEPN domain-containing protein